MLRKTIDGLRTADGDEAAEREVIDAYITGCIGASMSPMEIHDYSSISTPGVAGEASESLEKQDALRDVPAADDGARERIG